VVEIDHWREPDGRIAARFDYMIRNLSTGKVIGRATRLIFPFFIFTFKPHNRKQYPQLRDNNSTSVQLHFCSCLPGTEYYFLPEIFVNAELLIVKNMINW
jgi:hypothetical protein